MREKTLAITTIAFLVIFTLSMVYAESCSSLKGYWKFDETSGTFIKDSSGNNNNGLTVNMSDLNRITGKVNNALNFSSANQEFVSIPDSSSLDIVDEITMIAWVNPEAQNPTLCTNGGEILNKENSYELAITYSTNTIRWALNGPTGNGTVPYWTWYDTNISVPLNSWSFIVVTYSSSSHIGKTYLNGVLVDSYDVRTNPGYSQDKLLTTDYNLRIGARSYQHSTTSSLDTTCPSYFNGKIDEVAVYNKELSVSEILDIYNNGNGKTICKEEKKKHTGSGAVIIDGDSISYDNSSFNNSVLPLLGTLEVSKNNFSLSFWWILIGILIVLIIIFLIIIALSA